MQLYPKAMLMLRRRWRWQLQCHSDRERVRAYVILTPYPWSSMYLRRSWCWQLQCHSDRERVRAFATMTHYLEIWLRYTCVGGNVEWSRFVPVSESTLVAIYWELKNCLTYLEMVKVCNCIGGNPVVFTKLLYLSSSSDREYGAFSRGTKRGGGGLHLSRRWHHISYLASIWHNDQAECLFEKRWSQNSNMHICAGTI